MTPAALATVLLLAGASAPVSASQADPAAARPLAAALDDAARRDIVARLGAALRDQYVFPDVGARAADAIDAALAAGRYRALADPDAFAQRLSADLATIAHDKHLTVRTAGGPPPGRRAPRPHGEAGLVRADRLAGGIGYLEVIGFPPPRLFKPVLDRAMAALGGSRALIVDVRRNGGGAPESVAYLVSFLVKPGQPINTIVSRTERTRDETRQRYDAVATPVTFADAPVFVLTSTDTFSGGEEFAYDVQALRRGKVVGAVTGGGANPTGFVDLGHDIGAAVPFGRAENPTTRTNWEGRGVQPDIVVPAAAALGAALKQAGQAPVLDIAAASREQVFAPRAVPLPGSEAALRATVAGFASGTPDYATMTPELAARIREQVGDLQPRFAALGPLQTVTFHGPDMLGGDEYLLRFAHGVRMMALVLGPDGKIAAISTPMPVQP